MTREDTFNTLAQSLAHLQTQLHAICPQQPPHDLFPAVAIGGMLLCITVMGGCGMICEALAEKRRNGTGS